MKIKYATPATASVESLDEGAKNLDINMAEKLRAVAKTPADHHPHEVYFARLDDIAASRGMKGLELIGWRYLLEMEDGSHLSVEVYFDAESQLHTFAEINMGPFPKATREMLADINAVIGAENTEYTLSAIRILALHVFALWLRDEIGGKDLIVPLAPTYDPLEAGKPYVPDEFFKILKPKAEMMLKVDNCP